jgi:aminopeptidase N
VADANPGSALATRLDGFKRWYAQAGTPRVGARGWYDAAQRRYTLLLSQHTPATPGQPHKQPFVIPVQMALLAADGRTLAPEQLLVLDQAGQTFVFEDVAEPPVPSLLRGFSAPVQLNDGLSEAERGVLLSHDSDPFNRWEASQKLVEAALLAAIGSPAPQLQISANLLQALRGLLRHPTLDPAFKELALQPPGEGQLAEALAEARPGQVDPQRIHAVREQWRAQLAEQLHADWAWAYETHRVHEGYHPGAEQAGRRALANLALQMLCLQAVRSGDPVWPGRAYQLVKDAANMTDRLGALQALVDAHAPLAEAALERFHAAAHGDALVLDKWFALQARAPEPVGADGQATGSSFARARALLQHPDFSLRNPNRVRSLLPVLFGFNPAATYRRDGAGVQLWADKLLELDAVNPAVAARLARVMDRWATLAEPYRSAARKAIERVAAKPELSKDVREIVTKALESA